VPRLPIRSAKVWKSSNDLRFPASSVPSGWRAYWIAPMPNRMNADSAGSPSQSVRTYGTIVKAIPALIAP
jgi:hypothetical protein